MRFANLLALLIVVLSGAACQREATCVSRVLDRSSGGHVVFVSGAESEGGAAPARRVLEIERASFSESLDGRLDLFADRAGAPSVVVSMKAPPGRGDFSLTDLDARACETFYGSPSDDTFAHVASDVDAAPVHATRAVGAGCATLVGTLHVDVYDADCATRENACTQVSARLEVPAPAVLPDGPTMFGEVTVTQRYESRSYACDVGCGGPRGVFAPS